MDYTDEAAVWAMLTAPMTVVKGDGRTQVRIRKEPDSKSAAIGILTRATQGVRVIETLDNGWSLIECYSSSFADNTVKAWNLLVQGYVETNTLTTVEWDSNDKYGLVVDKLTQRLYVYEDGHLISTLLVSTGLANAKQPFNETRSGEYIIGSFTGEFTSGNLYCGMGLRYNDGDLLHEVPHTKRADGSKSYAYNEPKLGTRASHGCIRVQRLRNTEGLNMKWLWDNRKHLGRMVIWEDWQGRQIPIPDDDTVLYYNPNGGSYYHRADTCYSVTKDNVTFESFTYAQLDEEPYSKLDFCPYCAPATWLRGRFRRNPADSPARSASPPSAARVRAAFGTAPEPCGAGAYPSRARSRAGAGRAYRAGTIRHLAESASVWVFPAAAPRRQTCHGRSRQGASRGACPPAPPAPRA